jgi:hypothetical protein
MMTSVFRRLAFLFALSATACGSPQGSTGVGNPGLTSDQQALIADGNDGSESGDLGSSTVAIPLLALSTRASLADATTAANASAKVTDPTLKLFAPRTLGHCTSTVSGNVVTFDFVDCDGPLGLAKLNGHIVASFSTPTPGEVAVDIVSTGLTATVGLLLPRTTNVDVLAFAWIRFDGVTRVTGWNGSVDTTTARGESVHHTTNYDATYDILNACVTLDGTSATKFPLRGIKSALIGYRRCGDRRRCPSAGTLVFERDPGPLRVELVFDGGRHAHVTTDDGSVVPIGDGTPYPMSCVP